MRFSRSFCLLLTEFSLLIRTEISARSLPLCQILQIFTVNFQRYFRSKYKFCKIFECTRSLDLHLREPGLLARARAINGPGRARQETISSHLKATLFRGKEFCRILFCDVYVCVCFDSDNRKTMRKYHVNMFLKTVKLFLLIFQKPFVRKRYPGQPFSSQTPVTVYMNPSSDLDQPVLPGNPFGYPG